MKPLRSLEIDLRGTALIEASAGTGKTFTIATLYLRLLVEAEWQVNEILVVTYTRAATAELRDRIRRRVSEAALAFETADPGDDSVLERLLQRFPDDGRRAAATRRLNTALANFDQAAILTIHGFCQRALRENAFESRSGFDVELLVDQNALLREVVSDFWSKTIAREDEILVRFLEKKHPRVESLMNVGRHGAIADPPHVIPEESRVTREALELLAATWRAAVGDAREIWERDGKAVLALLLAARNEGALKGTPYQALKIESIWAAQTDRLLADLTLPISDNKELPQLLRFTREMLEEKTNDRHRTPRHPFFDACSRVSDCNGDLLVALRDHQITFERELITTVATELHARKEELGQQSYDDLLAQLSRALEGPGGERLARKLRMDYRVALVDEFQDTDQLQYSILSKIWCGEQSTLFLIGDPKQAIYAFRGADVHAYLGAKRDAGERCYTLATNWRSDPAMIEGVGALFARAQSPFGDEGIPFGTVSARPDARNELEDPTGEPRAAALDLLFYARADDKLVRKEVAEADLPWRVAADIARLLRGGARIESRDVRPGDIAVLCRTNAQTNAICRALREVGVPAALLGTASVFDTDEAQELEWVLDAIATPRSASRVRAALSTHLFGVVAETFDAFAEDEGQWDAWLRRFVGWHELWHKRGFIRMFHQLLRDGRVHLRLLEREGGERHLTNFLHLAELAERASLHDHLGPAGLVNWLARMRGDRDVRGNTIGEEGELRLETDEHAVKVVTVHKSKGLEYPIVYCPYLYESAALRRADKARVRFHDPACKTKIVLDLGSAQSEDHVAIAELESLAEDMRMLYVALTRAKHRCSIVWGGINGAANSALFSLLHPEAASSETFKTMDDEALREDLEGLVDASGGAVRLRDLPVVPAASVASEPVRVDFRPVDASREISSLWRHSSFSALAASKGDAPLDLSPAREEGIDHDAVVEPVALAGPVVAEHEIRLSALQPGAATGTLVHSILEHLDFQRPALEQFTGVIEERLDTHGVAAHEREQIAHDLDRIRETPWSAGGPRLLDLPRSQRLDELEFLLPVAGGEGASRSHKGMSVDALADVFRVHAEDDFQREYAERVARLRFDALAGYLKGYIDLVFDWNDRFYIVDYKSNHLGSQMTDYLPDRLDLPMAQHHYVLQYHLYTVALDRYLLQRVADYDYDRHFGGIYYLFLRGMDPGHAPGCGIFHHRPNRARIEALSVLLDDPGSLAA